MSEEIKETLDDVKRHLDYVEATKQSSIRDNEMKTMYEYITSLQQKVEQLENKIKYAQKIEQEYSALLTENTELENIRKEAIKVTKDVKQFVYDELVDRNVSGATETHCKIMDLLDILNKGSEFRCGKN